MNPLFRIMAGSHPYELMVETRRFGDLQRLLPSITQQMLTA